jgi:hypothetical protein
VSTRWRNGWRAILSVDMMERGFWLAGNSRLGYGWLQEWYRTLDQLLAHKDGIELELFSRLRDLFHLQAEMVFCDLTSTYFEGAGPAGLADFVYGTIDAHFAGNVSSKFRF